MILMFDIFIHPKTRSFESSVYMLEAFSYQKAYGLKFQIRMCKTDRVKGALLNMELF